MAQIVEHADGVYLNMTTEAYYADWALGGTSLKTLVTSPPDWWWQSPFNSLVPATETDEETKAKRFGTACHVALLEGMEVFNSTYGICPDKFTHPHALGTQAQLKGKLKELSLPVSGSKEEQVARLLEADPRLRKEILDCIIEDWAELGRKALGKTEHMRIRIMERALMGGGEMPVTDLGRAFVGGLSEVSVFWTDENGIRHRARFDKLKPNSSIDLKTFSNWEGRDFIKAILREAALRWYHVAAAHYEEGRRQLRRLVAEGKVFAPSSPNPELQAKIDADIALLHEIAKAEKWKWLWLFFKTTGAPRAKALVMDFAKKHENIYLEGVGMRNEALANFLHYREFFGLDQESKMWRDPEQLYTPEVEEWPFYAQRVD
jgi:hypothetical protein